MCSKSHPSAMLSEYDEFDSLRPPSPPLSDSSTGSAEREAISFPVHLLLQSGRLICVMRGDCRTSAGRLVHEVKKWYKDSGCPIKEDQVRLVVGKRIIRSMAVKLLDLFESHNFDDPLVVTAVVQNDDLSFVDV